MTASTKDGAGNGERVCLAAEGFGNRMCFLQSMANKVCNTHTVCVCVCVCVTER